MQDKKKKNNDSQDLQMVWQQQAYAILLLSEATQANQGERQTCGTLPSMAGHRSDSIPD